MTVKNVKIIHNPRCSKSRQALKILQDNQLDPVIIEYLKTPLTEKEITELLVLLNLQPRDIMRKNEAPYKDLQLDDPSLSREKLIQALAHNPILIERPIIVLNNKAIIARPPERILELL